jgi:hypothetical protein
MDKSLIATAASPSPIRLDPSPSKVFTWLEWNPEAEAVINERGHTVRPAGPTLTVRYRYNGAEHEFWPVTREEAQQVMNPGQLYGFSIGSAFGQIVKAHKSGRLVKSGERQETKKQREEVEQRSGRRWLA